MQYREKMEFWKNTSKSNYHKHPVQINVFYEPFNDKKNNIKKW